MDFTFFTADAPFISSFPPFLNHPQRPSYSFPPLSLEDFDSREVGLLHSKDIKNDEESPSEFFAATRQCTDMTNFSDSTPIDISNFFDMQGCSQSHSNFSLVDSINWDTKYTIPNPQSLQGSQLESKDDFLIWTNDHSHEKTTPTTQGSRAEMTPKGCRKGKKEARKPSIEENDETEEDEDVEEKDSKTLIKLAEVHKNDWKKIAKVYKDGKMSPSALKTRFKELMASPLQKRIKFTHKEDLMIAYYFEKIGSNWSQMANFFPSRTGIMLKNRYYSFIRKRNLLSELVEEGKGYEFEGNCDEKNYQSVIAGTQMTATASTLGLYNSKLTLNVGLGPQESFSNSETVEKEVCEKMEKEVETPEQKEIRLLNKRVKSLEALCAATRRELEKHVKV